MHIGCWRRNEVLFNLFLLYSCVLAGGAIFRANSSVAERVVYEGLGLFGSRDCAAGRGTAKAAPHPGCQIFTPQDLTKQSYLRTERAMSSKAQTPQDFPWFGAVMLYA
jgi:hypothetical protein